MKLHENKKLFRQAIEFTAQQKEILPIYVEKDYWVTYVLDTIFKDGIGKDTVFKGGTALSKCYASIERFSEDIDLVVLKRGDETGNQLSNKIKKIGNVVSKVLPEVQVNGLTHKMGMTRKTAHAYSKEFDGEYGQVRDTIVLEATWLGNSDPHTEKEIISMVGQMMLDTNQEQIAKDIGLLPFKVNVMEPQRTICEKIMSLVRFSYSENPSTDLKNKIRHTYDLHQLLKQKEYTDFLISPEFDKMLLRVANDDVVSFKNNNAWLTNHPKNALMFDKLDETWEELKISYNGDFKKLVYGELPNDSDVLNTLKQIKTRLAKVAWNLKIE
ncbi:MULTISPECIES: nucleotidyl transferase AbiEii/AbiGii toxin family protein [unclassified Carboxylicivirga]|uniref:nucleotidyl transferase AbiEii/AbiGii toxin family protein n=1 Tax=Carboxylicivirga TaxID=1628153 RepID=UPI003D329FEA